MKIRILFTICLLCHTLYIETSECLVKQTPSLSGRHSLNCSAIPLVRQDANLIQASLSEQPIQIGFCKRINCEYPQASIVCNEFSLKHDQLFVFFLKKIEWRYSSPFCRFVSVMELCLSKGNQYACCDHWRKVQRCTEGRVQKGGDSLDLCSQRDRQVGWRWSQIT